MGRGVAWLVGVVAALWIAALVPARLAAGPEGPWVSLVAGVVCLLPALGTWLVAYWSLTQSFTWQLAATLAGPMVRLFLVLLAGGGMLAASEYLRAEWPLFVATGVLYYLATLLTETVLVLKHRERRNPAPGGN